MTREELLEKAEDIAKKLDNVNDLDYAYTEGEEYSLKESVMSLTGKVPMMWERKGFNIQQSYSIMFTKLFLAYLISEIKEGNFLPKESLEKIKDCSVENFYDFYWDDHGYSITVIMEYLIENIITKDGIFSISEDLINTDIVHELEYMDESEERNDDYPECEDEAMARCIMESCPKLAKVTDEGELVPFMPGIAYYLKDNHEMDVWMVKISSSVLYDIIKREEEYPSELGKKIVDQYEEVLQSTLLADELYWGLDWTVVDDEDKMVHFFSVTGSDVYGDDCYYPAFSVDRLHKYGMICSLMK